MLGRRVNLKGNKQMKLRNPFGQLQMKVKIIHSTNALRYSFEKMHHYIVSYTPSKIKEYALKQFERIDYLISTL